MFATDYRVGDSIYLTVNAYTSSSNFIAYDFYDERINNCEPKDKQLEHENLGSILFGDRIYNSRYNITMLETKQCVQLCDDITKLKNTGFISRLIKENYRNNWYIDKLPVYDNKLGFQMGYIKDDSIFLYNHFDFKIQYNDQEGPDNINIVGVYVTPKSILSDDATCDSSRHSPILISEDTSFFYTYSVYFEHRNDLEWAHRWDHYEETAGDSNIHWYSLTNSCLIVLVLSVFVGIILLRTLRRDISNYNRLLDQEEELGWKVLHADVFRIPKFKSVFCVFVGSGIQLTLMTGVTLCFSVLGFLTPRNKGNIVTIIIIFYLLFAVVGGYINSRLYKMHNGKDWKQNTLQGALLIPGSFVLAVIILNFFLIALKSAGAVPFTALFAIIALWFFVSVPLSFLGSFLGLRSEKIANPINTAQIPRQIPRYAWYLRPVQAFLLAGILPFGSIFVEMYFIMKSIWSREFYYVFGFIYLVYLMMIITSGLVALVFCYFQLCVEDHQWKWRSLYIGGSSSFYVFLFSIYYYLTYIRIDTFSSFILYFAWSLILSFLIFLITGKQ